MAPKVEIIDNPYTRQLNILVDNKPLSAYSTLEKYMDEPFHYWCEKILPAIHEELNGGSFFFTLKSEKQNLIIMEKICNSVAYCIGFSGSSIDKSTPLTERMSKLNRLIQNNNLTGYRSVNHNAVFVVSQKYAGLKKELAEISIENLFCHVSVKTFFPEEYTFEDSNNTTVFIVCDKCDEERMINKIGMKSGFVVSFGEMCGFVKKEDDIFYFSTTMNNLFNTVFDCFKLVPLNDIFFNCVTTLSYDIKEKYKSELSDITGTSPLIIPKPESLNVEVGKSVCIKFESDFPGHQFAVSDMYFRYSVDGIIRCDGMRVVGLKEGKSKLLVYQKGQIKPSVELEYNVIFRNRIETIELDESEACIGLGDKTNLKYIFYPDDADNKDEIRFRSENDSIARVSSNGTVVAVSEGTCKIWVTAGNVSDCCVVSVLPHMKRIVFPESEIYIKPGEKLPIYIKTVPEVCVNNKLDYSCIDIRVANFANSKLIGVSCGGTKLVIQNRAENLRIDIPVHVGYRKEQKSKSKQGFLKRLLG